MMLAWGVGKENCMPFDKSKTVHNAPYNKTSDRLTTNQSGAAEAWWAHNPQVPGSKPGSDKREELPAPVFGLFPDWYHA